MFELLEQNIWEESVMGWLPLQGGATLGDGSSSSASAPDLAGFFQYFPLTLSPESVQHLWLMLHVGVSLGIHSMVSLFRHGK